MNEVEYYELNKENKMLTGHTWRTVVGLGLIATIGALQALHGQAGWSAWIDLVVPVLLVLEHALAGKIE